MPSFDMISLLRRFYAPPSGRILLDRTPIQNMDHKFYHTKMIIFLARMADGYDTKCGERGVQLSGGQKQRQSIGIVRNCSCQMLVIAHRLSTVRDTEKIAVIYEGYVAKLGNHKELMKDTDGM
ncbi:unnamed protein product [Caenorhabditis nigoni]